MLTQNEYIRYSRHLNLPDFSVQTQLQLKAARVLVVGAGGLGSPMLLYLAAAGVGTIGIVDDDVVDLSNLQRQVLYDTTDLGKPKCEIAALRLSALNPDINVYAHNIRLSSDNAEDIISGYDIVADGTDNFATRYLVNDACVLYNKVNVYASIYRYEGQVSVFNMLMPDGSRSANYRDLYPTPPPPGAVPDCATGGVLGVLAGTIGSLQANEVIKIITGSTDVLANKLMIYDSREPSMRNIHYKKSPKTEITSLIDYEHFCGTKAIKENIMSALQEITVQELQAWQKDNKDFQLIDVREGHEYEFANIGGELIPLGDVMGSLEKIDADKPKVVMCRSGQRSAAAVNALQQAGLTNLYNLKGGILAWSRDIDPSVPQY